MDDIDLSGLSGISSDQNSDFLGDDCGYFQVNNCNCDDDIPTVQVVKQTSVEVQVIEVEEEVKQITELTLQQPTDTQQQVSDNNGASHNRSKSYDGAKIIEHGGSNPKAQDIVVDNILPEDRGSVERRVGAQNSPKVDPKAQAIKLIKPNAVAAQVSGTRTSVQGLVFKKAESEHIQVKVDEFKDDPNTNKNKDKPNGKNMHEKMNSEDLGVLMPLFD